jgi:hypothetical protein
MLESNIENKQVNLEWIDLLRYRYRNRFWKDVPIPKKNDINWIVSKLANN